MKYIYLLIGILILIIGWHFFLVREFRQRMGNNAHVNPITNVVTYEFKISFKDASSKGAMNTVLEMKQANDAMKTSFAQSINEYARSKYDLYAFLIPYKVKISVIPQ